MPATPWEWENPVVKRSLTGRTRPRVDISFWGKIRIIFQVQERVEHQHMFNGKVGLRYVWRDAQPKDLSIGEKQWPEEKS